VAEPETSAAAADLARYYDLDLETDPGDLDLYLALAARTGGPILELAVGSGRLAVPLAAAGFEVVGVDTDEQMLERARRRWADASPADGGRLELVSADLAAVELGPRFGLAILALNSLLLLGDADRQQAALRALARHLSPTGLAAVDVWLPGADDLALYDGRLIHEWTRADPETGEQVAKLGSAGHDAATGTVDLHAIFDAWPAAGGPVHRVARRDRLRLVGAEELVRLAAEAGLAVERLAADHDLTPFGPGAERAVLIGRLV
jgi:SAM-dependent methyltransferase